MNKIIDLSTSEGLDESFFLHIAPNLGSREGKEILKLASKEEVGTTDIQLMLQGAVKEAGLLVLINKYVGKMTGRYPLGEKFNVRNSPTKIKELLELCKNNIKKKEMPTLVGVGDTITSNKKETGQEFFRGGSDRGFLTLIQELGKVYQKEKWYVDMQKY